MTSRELTNQERVRMLINQIGIENLLQALMDEVARRNVSSEDYLTRLHEDISHTLSHYQQRYGSIQGQES